jgi:hypothetical protein
MAERIGNNGYLALIKQASPNVVLTPTDYVALYDSSIQTNGNFVKQNPIYGGKYGTFNVLQGQRGHVGDVTIMGEPNTAGRMFDMLLTKSGTTGANPYTHSLSISNTVDPAFYTVDISTGNVVKRFWGVGASKISPSWNDNEMQLQASLSALGSFQGREIASIATTSVVLKTDYDQAPSKGLVVGDLVRVYKASTGATLDTTINTVAGDGITVTLGASAAAFAAGDMLYLRPASPNLNLLTPFTWSGTEFRFGATAAAALTATHTPLEQGSTWEIMHSFEEEEGSKRSGAVDPASLIRTIADATLSVKQFFDTPEAVRRFNALEKQAVVIRHFTGSTRQHELRITLNNIKTDGKVVADIKPEQVNYSEIDYIPQYDQTDGQAFDVKVVNGLATL